MTEAISSGLTHFEKSASGMAVRLAGVSIVPGRRQLAVMPDPLVSSAIASVRAMTPALGISWQMRRCLPGGPGIPRPLPLEPAAVENG
jgi:hypothetical protein